MSLELMVNKEMVKMKKYMVLGDIHGDYRDEKALDIAFKYMKEYQPSEIILNGDIVDFYSISQFDKNPDRKYDIQDEVNFTKQLFRDIRKYTRKGTKITYIKGNHEDRMQKYLWRNPELIGLEVLDLEHLLGLKDFKVNYINATGDYWKNDTGHYKVGDLLIMHGDNRLNGASTSQYSGYSAKNTMGKLQNSVLIGHNHRGAVVYHSTPYGDLVGIEGGCLCQKTGTANWQQGFVTFEKKGQKTINHQFHHIDDGKLYKEGVVYSSNKQNKKL
jgi:predicted phosphodiesterase